MNAPQEYQRLLERKGTMIRPAGLEKIPKLHNTLFDYQKNVVEFALRQGRAALFLDTGLGKTVCQLEWARHVPGDVLILAPPAVAPQTVRESHEMLGLNIHHSRDGSTLPNCKVTITNYERLHYFDVSRFAGVVLDESSILKSFMGSTKTKLCEAFANTPYRLCCSATPAPNDYMELGNHSAFLSIMPANEMLSRWFINDTMNFGNYRLKGHAVRPFWEWVASWAACAEKPSDAGGDDSRHALPPLTTKLHVVEAPMVSNIDQGLLFQGAEISATTMHADKRATMKNRCELTASLVNHGKPAIVWCESNDESATLAKLIPDCVEVKGSDDPDDKEAKLDLFSKRRARVIVTKPSIAGFGLNWQHAAHVVFASLSYSYESFYQAIRRSWRFGQNNPVHVDVVIASSEQNIWRTVMQKSNDHDGMKEAMRYAKFSSAQSKAIKLPYLSTNKTTLPKWLIEA